MNVKKTVNQNSLTKINEDDCDLCVLKKRMIDSDSGSHSIHAHYVGYKHYE